MTRSVERCDLLLTGGAVVTVDDDRRVLDPGAVAVTGDRIVGVGDAAELAGVTADRVVDCAGKAVVPGFLDCHNHLFQGLARGIGEGMSLWPWLCDFMWPYSATINTEEARVAALLGAVEAVRAGTTSVLDNHYAPADLDTTLQVAAAIEQVGMRGVVARGAYGSMTKVGADNGLPEALCGFTIDEEVDITRQAIEARPPGSRVGVWPAPINIIYNDQELVARLIELARDTGTGWHSHCSEAQIDPDIYLEYYGIRPIDWLAQEGLLGEEGVIAHGIWLDDSEVAHLGRAGAGISYNPESNEYLASGVLRLRALREAGAAVGLGTDGPGCGHRQDMFEQLKRAILLQRVHTLDPTVTSSEEVLELATREGARCMGIDAGVLAPGKLADIVVVDLQAPHLRPLHRVVATLAYAANGSDVDMTIVAGEVVYEDGRCTLVDEDEIAREAQARAEELVERAGMQALCVPWRARPRHTARH